MYTEVWQEDLTLIRQDSGLVWSAGWGGGINDQWHGYGKGTMVESGRCHGVVLMKDIGSS